jgi:hypothetical protein
VNLSDLGELQTWVLDHLTANYSHEPDWEDQEAFDEETNSYPTEDVIISVNEAVYVLSDPRDMLTLAAELLVGTLSGVEMAGTFTWSVDEVAADSAKEDDT